MIAEGKPSGSRVAAVQMVSGADVASNLQEAAALLSEAADAGATLAVLPENFACMPSDESYRRRIAEEDGEGPIQAFLCAQAERLKMWIVGGTIPIRVPDDDRPAAACLVCDATGRRVARYDKIYLFDVSLPGGQESYRESDNIWPGDTPVVIDSPIGRLGLAVCYDLRFPGLFRMLVDRGAQAIALPSAFTASTGRAHWEPLVRARAIENLVWVVASDQGGRHDGGRETFGDSMIVDPWGKILDRRATGPGVVTGDVDLKWQDDVRRRFPTLEHRKRP
jgi:nitrilase